MIKAFGDIVWEMDIVGLVKIDLPQSGKAPSIIRRKTKVRHAHTDGRPRKDFNPLLHHVDRKRFSE
jgi:hypothetical protein